MNPGKIIVDILPDLFLVVGLCMLLYNRNRTENANLNYLWIVVIGATLTRVAAMSESLIEDNVDLIWLRILLAGTAYFMRSLTALGMLLAVVRAEKRRRLLWIPQILFFFVCLSPYVTDLFWSFHPNDLGGVSWAGGPLSLTRFVVPFFYIFCTLVQVFYRFRDGAKREGQVLLVCAAFCIAAPVLESVYGSSIGDRLSTVILTCAVFYYIFIRFQDTDRDALTGLKTRRVCYEERERYHDIIAAVAYVDLNGLKSINDVIGHDEGDRALCVVGDALSAVVSKDVHAFRVGGDEFVLLFFTDKEETVQSVIDRVRRAVHRQGLSVAVGYAMRTGRESVHELAMLADKRMYENKAEYYERSGYDRRK